MQRGSWNHGPGRESPSLCGLGTLAGQAIADHGVEVSSVVTDAYERAINSTLVPEMRAGAIFLQAFERRPAAIHALMAGTPMGWWQFCQ